MTTDAAISDTTQAIRARLAALQAVSPLDLSPDAWRERCAEVNALRREIDRRLGSPVAAVPCPYCGTYCDGDCAAHSKPGPDRPDRTPRHKGDDYPA